jgi:hypothetical protein
MRLRLHDRRLLPDLLEFLSSSPDAVVSQVSEDELEVSLLTSMHGDAHALEVTLRLRAWEAARRATGSLEVIE